MKNLDYNLLNRHFLNRYKDISKVPNHLKKIIEDFDFKHNLNLFKNGLNDFKNLAQKENLIKDLKLEIGTLKNEAYTQSSIIDDLKVTIEQLNAKISSFELLNKSV